MFDSHCHFDFEAFDQDRKEVWQKCQQLGIRHLLIPGFCPEQWPKAKELCESNQDLVFAVGIHPYQAQLGAEMTETRFNQLLEPFLTSAHCVGIGECGLDKRIEVPIEEQTTVLNWHLRTAQKRDLPLTIHCVHADNEMIRALKQVNGSRGVIHAFSGSYEVGMQYIDMGFYLGIGGTITYARAQKTRNAVARLPLERLVLETDAPDMPLCGNQGERNSPEYLPEIAKTLAELQQTSVENVMRITVENTDHLFLCPN